MKIIQIGEWYITKATTYGTWENSSGLKDFELSLNHAILIDDYQADVIVTDLEKSGLNVKVSSVDIKIVKDRIDFLIKRENKLQLIEQLYRNGPVDLEKLSKLILNKDCIGKA